VGSNTPRWVTVDGVNLDGTTMPRPVSADGLPAENPSRWTQGGASGVNSSSAPSLTGGSDPGLPLGSDSSSSSAPLPSLFIDDGGPYFAPYVPDFLQEQFYWDLRAYGAERHSREELWPGYGESLLPVR
jgi:hypothetical protein